MPTKVCSGDRSFVKVGRGTDRPNGTEFSAVQNFAFLDHEMVCMVSEVKPKWVQYI